MKMRKVKLSICEEPLEGYITRNWNEDRTRYNTWNGWEIPFFTLEQVKAWLPTQDELHEISGPEGCDKWELNFNEETQEEELWVYDWNNMFLAESLEAFMADNGGEAPHGEHGDGYMVTKHGIFSDEIVHKLFDAETFDGEKIRVFPSPCYTWELGSEEDD